MSDYSANRAKRKSSTNLDVIGGLSKKSSQRLTKSPSAHSNRSIAKKSSSHSVTFKNKAATPSAALKMKKEE